MQSTIPFLYTLLLLICLSTACSTKKQVVNPKAPQRSTPTQAQRGGSIQANPPVSIIKMPISIPIAALADRVNQEMPVGSAMYSEDQYSPVSGFKALAYKLAIWKIGNVKLRGEGDYLYTSLPLRANVSIKENSRILGALRKKPIESEVALWVNVRTKVGLSNNWELQTKTELLGYDWVEEPTINMLGASLKVTRIADAALNRMLPGVMPQIDQMISEQADFKKLLNDSWAEIQEPYLVTQNPAPVWLRLEPLEVMMTPMRAVNNVFQVAVGVKMVSETIIGDRPASPRSMAPLPPISKVNSLDDAFSIYLSAGISYDDLTQLAQQQLVGQTYHYRKGKKSVKVQHVEVYPSGNELVASIYLKGNINGRVFLRGRPTYDPQSELLYMNGLDFDLESKNVLLKTADWLAHRAFIRKMDEYMRFDLTEQLMEVKQEANTVMHRLPLGDYATFVGELVDLYPQQILLTDQGVETVVEARGKAKVILMGEE